MGLRGTEQLKRLMLHPFTLSQRYKLPHAQVGHFTCRTRSRAGWEKTSSDPSLVPNLNQDSQESERRLRGTTPCTGCGGRLPSRREVLRTPGTKLTVDISGAPVSGPIPSSTTRVAAVDHARLECESASGTRGRQEEEGGSPGCSPEDEGPRLQPLPAVPGTLSSPVS